MTARAPQPIGASARRPARAVRRPQLALAALVALLVAAGPRPALAAIHPASVVDGPANDILDVDGTAMAPDGSGGIVYRKQVEDVTHVFAVALQNGSWGAPVEVDREDPYGASQPVIAAGNGGRLLVVWVQPRNLNSKGVPEYELMSASQQPGAGGFGQPIAVDSNVGEPITGDVSGVDPRLAMAPDGSAYVVYRAVLDDCGPLDFGQGDINPNCLPNSSDKLVDVRVARFGYLTWSSLGTINRAPQLAMRNPTNANAPAIGIGIDGNGLVAWQEPDASGVARVWARRLFGNVPGTVLQASPATIAGRPVSSDADAPAVAVGPLGEARIAFRIEGATGTVVPQTQLFVNSILSETAVHGSALQGVVAIRGATGAVGVPSAAIDRKEEFRLAWTQASSALTLTGDTRALGSPAAIGSSSGQAQTTINPAGGGTTAWSTPDNGAVQAREDYAGGAFQAAQLAGGAAGTVSGVSLAGSGEGDALIGWMQGPPGRSEVVGDFVQAPPAPFVVSAPVGWVRARDATIEWEPSSDAVAGFTYTVYVDGRPFRRGLRATSATLSSARLGDGRHHVQILAVDSAGQQTMSARTPLKIDANPPIVSIGLIDRGAGVRVRVRDRASGVAARATRIAFGDGSTARGRADVTHRYARPGAYTITASVRDRVGNSATVHLRVRVS